MGERRQTERVPQLLVERLALGELPPDEARSVEARLAREPGGPERLAEVRRSNAEILLAHPPRAEVPAILKKAGRTPRAKWLKLGGFLVPVAMAAAAFAIFARPPADPERIPVDPAAVGPEVLTAKGSHETTLPPGVTATPANAPTHLCIHRKSGQNAEKLEPGAGVHPRDLLQVAYFANGESTYGVILSIDGRGGVTLHYPEQPGRSQALAKGSEVALAHAYELDDAPGFERFFFVTSDSPVDVDAVLAQARALAQHPNDAVAKYLDLPGGLRQTSLTLHKEP